MNRTTQARLSKLEASQAPQIPTSVIIRRGDPLEVKAAAVAEYRRLQRGRVAPMLIVGREDEETQRLLRESA
jgi:hypothetical protein